MTTRITVNVSGNRLLENNKEQQLANRNSFLESKVDEQFIKEVKAIEATVPPPPVGGVPEYGIQQETSAQRKGEDLGIGWMYETYIDSFENPGETEEQYRIAFGSGDGSSWEYIDLAQDTPSGLPPPTRYGFYELSTELEIIDEKTVFFAPQQRGLQWQRYYKVTRDNFKFVLPVGGSQGAGCIVVGCARIYARVRKEYSYVPEGGYPTICSTGIPIQMENYFGGCLDVGDIVMIINQNPSIGILVTFYQNIGSYIDGVDDPIIGDYSYFLNTANGLRVYVYKAYVSPYNYAGYDGTEISTFGQPSYEFKYREGFEKPDDITQFEQATRVNYAFYINHRTCTRLEVSPELDSALNALLPSEQEFWDNVSNGETDGPAWGYAYDGQLSNEFIYGSPGIYEIIKNNYDFSYFDFDIEDPQPMQSEVTSQIPITAPDLTTEQSAFSFATKFYDNQLSPNPQIPYPSGTDPLIAYNGISYAYLLDYIYMPSLERPDSIYKDVVDSDALPIIQDIPENPEFWIWVKRRNPGGILPNEPGLLPTLLPDGQYQTAIKLKLSSQRILPPALSLSGHPMMTLQTKRTLEGLGIFSSSFSPQTLVFSPYTNAKLVCILWTDWGAGSQLRQIRSLGLSKNLAFNGS